MFYVRWTIRILVLLLVASTLHYTLPQWDIARITDTEVRRVDFGQNALFWSAPDVGQPDGTNRDVRFINARLADGQVMVYRNEDTGWRWPPYFKLNSSNLQAEASDLVSVQSDAEPQWVGIKHYGWRSEFLSIFPNAVRIKKVDGPDAQIIPWTSIVLLVLIIALFSAIYVRWRRFWAARVDPVVEGVVDRWEGLDDEYAERRSAFRRMTDWITRRKPE